MSLNMFAKTVYCHYFDEDQKPLGKPFESVVFPESVVYCARRPKSRFVSLSEKIDDKLNIPVKLIDRTMKNFKHFFSVCLAPLYGSEPKWLWVTEFIEHYKIQGATYFYIYITEDLHPYDRRVLDDYVRTGNVEVISIVDRFKRDPRHWQTIQVHDCHLRNRHFANWTAFVDTDERILVNDTIGTVVDYLRSINDSTIGAVTFRQRWLAKDETMPRKYEDEKKVIEWMPTQKYHNTSAVTGNGWVVKTIIQPLKVFYMWIHYPRIMMKPYWGYSVKPEEGFSRHYRNDNAWSRQRLPEFGNFSMTEYPRKYNQQLIDAVTKRLKYVYEYEAEETNRVSRVENGYQDTIAPKIVV